MHVLLKHATKYLGAETVCLRYTNFHHNEYRVLFSDRGASDSLPLASFPEVHGTRSTTCWNGACVEGRQRG